MYRQPLTLATWITLITLLGSVPVGAQLSGKKPDRKSYVPPTLPEPAPRDRAVNRANAVAQIPEPPGHTGQPLRPVGHERVVLRDPSTDPTVSAEFTDTTATTIHADAMLGLAAYDCCDGSGCDRCCDSLGCDGFGDCGGTEDCWWRRANASISCDPCDWFASAELLLMFRKGDLLPPLVTTGPSTDPDTAGQLGEPGTQILLGNQTTLRDMTAGGRFMLGTWLDTQHCRSLTLRGWFAGEESFGFQADGSTAAVIARPFFNVTDSDNPEQDTRLIVFPNEATGSIEVQADSNVYGADVAVRQHWYGGLGATVDLLYGYQYFHLDENLRIGNSSIAVSDVIAPIGSLIAVNDNFETDNNFHGGQLGIASRYREGCWSFDGLFKIGFGNMQRRVRRSGRTVTSIDGASAVDNQGLLVRQTNSGTETDNTFGWAPELDLTLGWQRYPCFDVTVGYHLSVLTDAVQLSGSIDPQLAVNLSDPLTGAARPSGALRYDTFYIQGIHFGLRYVY